MKQAITKDDKQAAANFVQWMKRNGYQFESNDAELMRKNLWPFFARHREKCTGIRIVERRKDSQ